MIIEDDKKLTAENIFMEVYYVLYAVKSALGNPSDT
jgi:hypothetical protein